MNKNAFDKLSYGVYIIASGCADKKNAFVATTVFQVTSEPLQIALACNKKNHTAKFIEKFKNFSVSVLQQNYTPSVLGKFGFHSGRDTDKFLDTHYKISPYTQAPIILDDAIAWFECRLVKNLDVGTHILFIGEVVNAEVLSEEQPLTYSYYHEVKKGKIPANAPQGSPENPTIESINNSQKSNTMKKYVCKICGYIYDPAAGDPDGGVAPGTAFEDLPEDWVCPMCGVTKEDFEPES